MFHRPPCGSPTSFRRRRRDRSRATVWWRCQWYWVARPSCSAVAASQEIFGLGWPEGITPEARLNRDLWVGSVIASFVVGGIVWALIFWTSAFHRKKDTDTELPRQFGYNMPLELGAHRGAVPDHLGALLLHRGGAGADAAQGSQPRGRHRRHRLPVELEVRVPEDRIRRRHAVLRRCRQRAQGSHGLGARGCRRAR